MKCHIGSPRRKHDELLSDTTINLTSSMSNARIQAIIDQVPKVLMANLTFQFADGTYTPGAGEQLVFGAFEGPGTLAIQGNPSESGLHTNQAVVFTLGTSHAANFMHLMSCSCPILVRNIRFNRSSSAASYRISLYNLRSKSVTVTGCCFGATGRYDYGIYTIFGTTEAYLNRVGSHDVFMYSLECGITLGHDNGEISGSDYPRYVYVCQGAGSMGYYGTLPTALLGPVTHLGGRTWT